MVILRRNNDRNQWRLLNNITLAPKTKRHMLFNVSILFSRYDTLTQHALLVDICIRLTVGIHRS